MASKKIPEVIRLRRKWALELAESLAREFDLGPITFDIDRAARFLELNLPTSADEALAEYEEWQRIDEAATEPEPSSPGILERLRTALGYDPGTLKQMMEAVIVRIEQCRCDDKRWAAAFKADPIGDNYFPTLEAAKLACERHKAEQEKR